MTATARAYNILDHLPPPAKKSPQDRLAELRDYAEALAVRAEYRNEGCVRDLYDIVKALDELRDLRGWTSEQMNPTNWTPQPKRMTAGRVPQPKAPQPKVPQPK